MWDTEAQTALYSEPHATLLKKLFAAAWLRMPDNPFAAAREVEDHTGRSIYIGQRWVNDEIVLAEKARLQAVLGPISKVPTKEQFAAEVYLQAKECKTQGDKLAYLKFFADVIGYVERAGNGSNINVNVAMGAKIMAVPIAASDEQWETAARKHQDMLATRHG